MDKIDSFNLRLRDENLVVLSPESQFIYDMEYLNPSQEVKNLSHPNDYVYREDPHGNPMRNIFYNQSFTLIEMNLVNQLEVLLNQEKVILPEGWTKLKTLKYLHNEQLDLKKALIKIKKNIEWLSDSQIQNITSEIIDKYLGKGVMYTFGRDKFFRPIIVINAHQIKIDKKKEYQAQIKEINGALCRLFNTVQKNMLVEGKVENWIIFIDTSCMGILEIDFKIIEMIVECMVTNFTCILHKMFILNPTWILKQIWNIISAFIPKETLQKIKFLSKEHFSLLQELDIEKDQIEQRFGGEIENLNHFWPPNKITNLKCINSIRAPSQEESSYYYSMINTSNFDEKNEDKTQEEIFQNEVLVQEMYADKSFDLPQTSSCCNISEKCNIF